MSLLAVLAVALACAAVLVIPGDGTNVDAEPFVIDGIEYEFDGDSATVTGFTGEPKEVVIPATVTNGGVTHPVTAIVDIAFLYAPP